MSTAPRAPGPQAFPTARWVALAWIAVWAPVYLWKYGPGVFVNLCDVALFLLVLGLWRGSPLLVSSQAVSSLVIDAAWVLDLAWRAATSRHLIGGTEYMWDPRYPLWLRALSLFHFVLPVALVWAVRQVGYDRRAFALQSTIAAVGLVGARFLTSPEENQNFAFKDPFGRVWGPPPAHLAVIWVVLVGVVYWPTHRALHRWMPAVRSVVARPSNGSI